MTTYYWYGDSGNWSDYTNHWSLNSGNSPASPAPAAPTSSIDVRFDSNSFTTGSQTVTVDATANCKDLDFTGATNTPTLSFTTFGLSVYGNITYIAAMVATGTSGTTGIYFLGAGIQSVKSNGLATTLFHRTATGYSGTVSLSDAYSSLKGFQVRGGTLLTNNNNMSVATFTDGTINAAKTLTLGSSTITCTSWDFSAGGQVVSANTATINCSGNFAGGGITTYHIVNLTGATSTISGNNSFNTLTVDRSVAANTIVATGTTQVVNDFKCAMNGKNGLAITGGTWILPNARRVITDFLTATNMTVSAGQWYAGYHSTDGGGNSGLMFRMPNRDKMICGVNL